MVNPSNSHRPSISYRQIKPSDLTILERLHTEIFPIRYESEFFQNVANHRDIISWAAVDRNKPNEKGDELIGFITARVVLAKDSDIGDFLKYNPSKPDETLVYILTLGVVSAYRNHGIATTLVKEVIKFASSIATCRALYLHVISYNTPAILFYKKMSFKCARQLQGFYLIGGQHYDSYLFVYYLTGGRSPCSPLEVVSMAVGYMTSGLKSVAGLMKKEGKSQRWHKCKDSHSLLSVPSKKSVTGESLDYECV